MAALSIKKDLQIELKLLVYTDFVFETLRCCNGGNRFSRILIKLSHCGINELGWLYQAFYILL